MAVGKNKRMSKGKKGGKKKAYVIRRDALTRVRRVWCIRAREGCVHARDSRLGSRAGAGGIAKTALGVRRAR